MDQLDREVIESLSEPAKRVFGSLDYRSRQRMLKKARAMAKEEKTRNQKKNRIKPKERKRAVHSKMSVSFFLFMKQRNLWCSPCSCYCLEAAWETMLMKKKNPLIRMIHKLLYPERSFKRAVGWQWEVCGL